MSATKQNGIAMGGRWRRSKHTYWLWESYPDLIAPKPVEKDDVDTVRRIVNLALGDGMEILILMALLNRE